MVAAAIAKAERNHWRGVIAVVHDGGWLIVLERMDHAAMTASVELAAGKARAAALFKKPTQELGGRRGPRHLLSGFLVCEECGGSFHAMNRPDIYGCGWHRDRGSDVCSSTLRVPRTALEDRILGAIREQILVPEIIARTTKRVLEKVAAGLRKANPGTLHKRLSEIDRELANLTRLAARTGDVDEIADHYAELVRERASLQGRVAARPAMPDMDSLRASAEARVLEIKTSLEDTTSNGVPPAARSWPGDVSGSAPIPSASSEWVGSLKSSYPPERRAGRVV